MNPAAHCVNPRLLSLPELVNLVGAVSRCLTGNDSEGEQLRATLAVPVAHLASCNRRAVVHAAGDAGRGWTATQILAAAQGPQTPDLEAAYALVREARDHLRHGPFDAADLTCLELLFSSHCALTDALVLGDRGGSAPGTLLTAGRRVRAH